jgi:hypothetical protein
MPWILADYTSETLDLDAPGALRDLSKPIGAMNDVQTRRFAHLISVCLLFFFFSVAHHSFVCSICLFDRLSERVAVLGCHHSTHYRCVHYFVSFFRCNSRVLISFFSVTRRTRQRGSARAPLPHPNGALHNAALGPPKRLLRRTRSPLSLRRAVLELGEQADWRREGAHPGVVLSS